MWETMIADSSLSDFSSDVYWRHNPQFDELDIWDPGLAKRAVWLKASNYALLPEKYRTFELSELALTTDPLLLEYVPRDQKFRDNGYLCRLALKADDNAAQFVPEYFKYDWRN